MKKRYSVCIVLLLVLIMTSNVFAKGNNLENPISVQTSNELVTAEFLGENNLENDLEQLLTDKIDKYTQEGKRVLGISPIYLELENKSYSRASIGGTMEVSCLGDLVYVDITVTAPDLITYMSVDLDVSDITSFRYYDNISGIRFGSPIQYDQFQFRYTGYNSFINVKIEGDVTGVFGRGSFRSPTKQIYF